MKVAVEKVKLKSICDINPRQEKTLGPDDQVTFVPMAAVNERSGQIERPETRKKGEVEKGFTPFIENDVLFAKITPCMENGKAAIARKLVNGVGYGSTEFHVLRPNYELVRSEWLFYYLRSMRFRKLAKAQMTGSAGQQRVPRAFLEEALIPLPALKEQDRIIKAFTSCDHLRNWRDESFQLISEYLTSAFDQYFSEKECKRNNWQSSSIEDALELLNGRAFKSSEWSKTGKPIIRIQNLKDPAATYNFYEGDAGNRFKIQPGNVLFSWAGQRVSIGCYLWQGPEGWLNQHIFKVVPKLPFNSDFLVFCLNSLVPRLVHMTQGIEMQHLTKETLNSIEIPVPPLEVQEAFANKVVRLRSIRKLAETSAAAVDGLREALSATHFG